MDKAEASDYSGHVYSLGSAAVGAGYVYDDNGSHAVVLIVPYEEDVAFAIPMDQLNVLVVSCVIQAHRLEPALVHDSLVRAVHAIASEYSNDVDETS